MSDYFSTYVEAERAKLTEARQSLMAERQSIDARLTALNNEFAAIDAYEAAKTGRAIARVGAATPRSGRTRNGSRRESILAVLRNAPQGMSRGELLDACGVKGDKAGEGSVSNALSALQKDGRVMRRPLGGWAIVADDGLRQAAE